jgi:hypothetical protein
MLKPEQIPIDVVMPIAVALYEATTGLERGDFCYLADGYDYHWDEAEKLVAAAINAWPGMNSRWVPSMVADDCKAIILPLNTENTNDKV